jgi:hypothetical protein
MSIDGWVDNYLGNHNIGFPESPEFDRRVQRFALMSFASSICAVITPGLAISALAIRFPKTSLILGTIHMGLLYVNTTNRQRIEKMTLGRTELQQLGTSEQIKAISSTLDELCEKYPLTREPRIEIDKKVNLIGSRSSHNIITIGNRLLESEGPQSLSSSIGHEYGHLVRQDGHVLNCGILVRNAVTVLLAAKTNNPYVGCLGYLVGQCMLSIYSLHAEKEADKFTAENVSNGEVKLLASMSHAFREEASRIGYFYPHFRYNGVHPTRKLLGASQMENMLCTNAHPTTPQRLTWALQYLHDEQKQSSPWNVKKIFTTPFAGHAMSVHTAVTLMIGGIEWGRSNPTEIDQGVEDAFREWRQVTIESREQAARKES